MKKIGIAAFANFLGGFCCGYIAGVSGPGLVFLKAAYPDVPQSELAVI
jgi:hypothetical protein